MISTARSALLVLFLLAAAAPGHAAQAAKNTILVAAKALGSGDELAEGDFVAKPLPKGFPAQAAVPAARLPKLTGLRLLEPLEPGEPLRPTQLTTAFDVTTWRAYCDALPESVRARADKSRPYPRRLSVDRSPVLVAARPLPAGTTITARDFRARKLPNQVVGPFAVPHDGLQALVGKHLLVPLAQNEPLRFPQVAEHVNEPRCRWLFRAFGNVFSDRAPADASAVVCPEGSSPLSGIPGGKDWTPDLPGWAVACRKPDGTRHGPFISWHRHSSERRDVGQFLNGKRSGRWQQISELGRLQQERSFENGKLHGPFIRWTWRLVQLINGSFAQGYRQGAWTFSDPGGLTYLRAEFDAGLARGRWSWADSDGYTMATGQFLGGVPSGRWVFLDWKGEETGHVDYVKGKPAKLSADQKTAPIYVASRDLEPGHRVSESDFQSLLLPERLVLPDFVSPESASEVIGKPLFVAIPKGGIVFRMDFDADDAGWEPDPVPLEPAMRTAAPASE